MRVALVALLLVVGQAPETPPPAVTYHEDPFPSSATPPAPPVIDRLPDTR